MNSKPVNTSSWTSNRAVGLTLSVFAMAASMYFPGAGFPLFFAFQNRLDRYKRRTVITLIVLELIYLVTALGTVFGPVIGKVGV
jgi:hypothetical protein